MQRFRQLLSSDVLSDEERAAIEQEYFLRFNKKFDQSFNTSCPNRYADAIILILRDMKKIDNGGYELKKGIAFRLKGGHKVYTSKNLTESAAIAYIAEDPRNIMNFSAIPDELETK